MLTAQEAKELATAQQNRFLREILKQVKTHAEAGLFELKTTGLGMTDSRELIDYLKEKLEELSYNVEIKRYEYSGETRSDYHDKVLNLVVRWD